MDGMCVGGEDSFVGGGLFDGELFCLFDCENF